MENPQALQLRVGVDVGSQRHCVAVGLSDDLDEVETMKTRTYGPLFRGGFTL